jgi:hypothetical protein
VAPKRDPIEAALGGHPPGSRVLRAKPEALAARGKLRPPADLLVLRIESTPAQRLADATGALVLLENATRMISEARTRLLAAGADALHPATVAAGKAVSESMKAMDGARFVVKTLTR